MRPKGINYFKLELFKEMIIIKDGKNRLLSYVKIIIQKVSM